MTDGEGNVYTYTYDLAGNLTSETDPKGNKTTYRYDKDHNLVEKINSLGDSTRYYYDGVGHLVQTYTYREVSWPSSGSNRARAGSGYVPEKHGFSADYDADGRQVETSTPLGLVTRYEYDEMGRLTKTIHPDGSTTSSTYDANGNKLTDTDARGNITTYTYDANGNLLTTTDPEGNTTANTYDLNDRRITYTDPKGGIVSFTYDKNGNMTSVKDARGYTTSFTYDKNNRQTTTTDRTGAVTAYTYDGNGNVTSVTKPTGGVFSTEYNKNNQVVAYTDALGFTEHRTYDANGNLSSLTDRRGNTTTYEYDALNQLVKVTDPLGGETTYTYDEKGQITEVTNALGGKTTTHYDAEGQPYCIGNELSTGTGGLHNVIYQYDKMGRVAIKFNEDGTSIHYTYDRNGNVLKETYDNGAFISYFYNKNSQRTMMIDALGNKTRYTYTPSGMLETETDALDGKTVYTYDANDNVASIQDPEGNTVFYTYDGENRIATARDANGNVYRYTYDGNGNLVKVRNPDGGVETYTYDLNDQMTAFADAEGNKTMYAYDENGNLIKVTDPMGNFQTSEYDALNRQTVLTNEEGGKVTYTYDALGRVVKAVNEDGAVTEYTHDAKGRVLAIKDAYGHYRRFEYDPMDRVTAETDENGVRRTYEYDAVGNLVKYTDGLGNSETYTYDKNGNRVSLTDRNGNTYTYTYDALNRVTGETDPKGNTKAFTYDKNGRIVAVTDRNGNTTQYKLDGNGNIVESIDAMGTSSLFAYDSMNRLVSVKLHRVDTIHKVDEWQETLYTYDHRGLVKTEVNAAGDGKIYVYDGNGNLVEETDEDGYVTQYAYSPVNLVSEINYDGGKTVSFLYDGTGDLIEMNDWNGKTTIAVDLLDRITKVTDHNGMVVQYAYDAAGNQISIGYPDCSQVDYWYDAENHVTQVQDFTGDATTYTYDANGNKISREYPNYETTHYYYDECNQLIEMDEFRSRGNPLYKSYYTYDAVGNRLKIKRYDYRQDCNGKFNDTAITEEAVPETVDITGQISTDDDLTLDEADSTYVIQDIRMLEDTDLALQALETADPENGLASLDPVVNDVVLPSLEETDAGAILESMKPSVAGTDLTLPDVEGEPSKPGNANDNGSTGLTRGELNHKPGNPHKPIHPGKPKPEPNVYVSTMTYTYDKLNRLTSSSDGRTTTTYTYDTLGNLIRERAQGRVTDYRYNCLNQLVQKSYCGHTIKYSYDKRGNRVSEVEKRFSQSYDYDETNRMVSGTNYNGDTSRYVYNGLGMRVQNTVLNRCRTVYNQYYVVDYTSPERNDLFSVTAAGCRTQYIQKYAYAGGEQIELSSYGPCRYNLLYVHEDERGSVSYYSKPNGGVYTRQVYDDWGAPQITGWLCSGDQGNYIYTNYTGHSYDVILGVYFADARFYDATNRAWLARDPAKDGLNWYQYCGSNPITRVDPTGENWLTDAWDSATNWVSDKYNDAKDWVEEKVEVATEWVEEKVDAAAEWTANAVETVKNEVTEFVEDPGAYFEQLKCDISVWWNRNKASVIKGLVGLGAFALTAVATAATGGLGLVFAGAAVGAWQYGANSLVDQNYSIYKVDYAKVGKEALKGGVISVISGGAGQLAANAAAPLNFCGQSFLQAAGDVATHWAAGFVADGATGMATTFVSELIDGKSLEEAFDATVSSSGDIWGNAALTASFGTIADAMVAPKCFVAGTMVVTAAGLVAIETIQPGDMVLAADEETGEYAYKEVVRTFVNTTEEITHVTISDGEGVQEVIDSTPQHPFYVEGKGWVEASALHAGMTIWFANGTKGTVEDISNEGLEEPVTVYNFEVADFHTYFVGECGVLVHNTCSDVPNPNGKKGGQAHQDTIDSIESTHTGGSIEREVKFDTPEGTKTRRFADAVEIVDGEITSIHQVGKVNQNGLPVARESRAITDIMNSPDYNGAPIFFWPYNSDSGPIIYQP